MLKRELTGSSTTDAVPAQRSGSVDDEARRAMVQSFKDAASGMGSMRRVGGFGGILAGAGTPRGSTPGGGSTPRDGASKGARGRPQSARLTPTPRRKIRTAARMYSPGDLVGEIALIHSAPRDASIFASDDASADVPGQGGCEVWVLPRLLLRQVLAATRSSGVSAARGLGAAAGRRGGISLGSVVAAAQQQQQKELEQKTERRLTRASSHAVLTRRRSASQMTRAMLRGDLDSAAVLALDQLRTLGEGSFGLVRLAARAGAGARAGAEAGAGRKLAGSAGGSAPMLYALKVLVKGQVVANRQERQVLAEKEALCILRDRSPFVVHLIGTAQTSSRLLMCLELCDGGDLSVLLDEVSFILPLHFTRIMLTI